MSGCLGDVPIEGVEGMLDGVEVDHFLEEFETAVADLIVREESN